jgi:2-(1,2-epoxy-1,2-dihydrophenyl)acetyl-CoA isomerase
MTSTYDTLLVASASGLLEITLNRPDVLNAFNEQLSADLLDVFTRARDDDAVRAVLLTGAGRAFCSGQDLRDIDEQPDRSLAESLERLYNPLIRAMRALPKPVIAAINGACAGAGLSLALACDLRYASDRAKLIQVFVRIGLVPDSGSSWFMPRLVGYARAFELCATGRDVSAAEAERIGLVNAVLPHDLLLDHARTVGLRLAQGPTQAIGQIKDMLSHALAGDLDAALLLEEQQQERAGFSDDYREGRRAFLEKRPPAFTGR